MRNLTSEIRWEFIKISFENCICQEWNGHLQFFSRPQAIENCIGNICFSEQIIYRKQSLDAPELGSREKKKKFMVDFD